VAAVVGGAVVVVVGGLVEVVTAGAEVVVVVGLVVVVVDGTLVAGEITPVVVVGVAASEELATGSATNPPRMSTGKAITVILAAVVGRLPHHAHTRRMAGTLRNVAGSSVSYGDGRARRWSIVADRIAGFEKSAFSGTVWRRWSTAGGPPGAQRRRVVAGGRGRPDGAGRRGDGSRRRLVRSLPCPAPPAAAAPSAGSTSPGGAPTR
jgi:hypothetical protein